MGGGGAKGGGGGTHTRYSFRFSLGHPRTVSVLKLIPAWSLYILEDEKGTRAN